MTTLCLHSVVVATKTEPFWNIPTCIWEWDRGGRFFFVPVKCFSRNFETLPRAFYCFFICFFNPLVNYPGVDLLFCDDLLTTTYSTSSVILRSCVQTRDIDVISKLSCFVGCFGMFDNVGMLWTITFFLCLLRKSWWLKRDRSWTQTRKSEAVGEKKYTGDYDSQYVSVRVAVCGAVSVKLLTTPGLKLDSLSFKVYYQLFWTYRGQRCWLLQTEWRCKLSPEIIGKKIQCVY